MRIPLDEFTRRFEAATLPHLGAAYNLARWLLRDAVQAEDVVQEAYLRALRHFDSLRGSDARPWLLGIVRHACHDCLRRQQRQGEHVAFDEQADSPEAPGADPVLQWEAHRRVAGVDAALRALPPLFREVIVLRELEEMSYDEIAHVAGIPLGTVMSRLSRARALLRESLRDEAAELLPPRKRDAKA